MLECKMKFKICISFVLVLSLNSVCWATQSDLENILVKTSKVEYKVDALEHDRILFLANEAMTFPLVSITNTVSPYTEGGIHDFYSNGDYWWPNPSSVDGLPFIQKDGQSNPANFNAHRLAIRQLVDSVAALAMAHKITGEDRYVKKAETFLNGRFQEASAKSEA